MTTDCCVTHVTLMTQFRVYTDRVYAIQINVQQGHKRHHGSHREHRRVGTFIPFAGGAPKTERAGAATKVEAPKPGRFNPTVTVGQKSTVHPRGKQTGVLSYQPKLAEGRNQVCPHLLVPSRGIYFSNGLANRRRTLVCWQLLHSFPRHPRENHEFFNDIVVGHAQT